MIKKLLVVSLVAAWSSVAAADEQNLEFESGYVVDGVDDLQPSGLAVCNGKVLFVSDKHESEIFQVTFGQDGVATAETWKKLTDLPEPPQQKFSWWMSFKRFLAELFGLSGGADWEGVACDEHGSLFLASEYYFSVLKIDSTGKQEWMVDDLYQNGNEKGLFQKDNAYIEGIMVSGEELLLAAEREPRGLISIKNGSKSIHVQAGAQISEEGLPYDYTGLDRYQGKTIALERNHYKVCDLDNGHEATSCYSFKSVAMSPDWGFDTGKYGLAEGIAVETDSLWIIIDNNGEVRRSSHEDTRSVILKFKNPF